MKKFRKVLRGWMKKEYIVVVGREASEIDRGARLHIYKKSCASGEIKVKVTIEQIG